MVPNRAKRNIYQSMLNLQSFRGSLKIVNITKDIFLKFTIYKHPIFRKISLIGNIPYGKELID